MENGWDPTTIKPHPKGNGGPYSKYFLDTGTAITEDEWLSIPADSERVTWEVSRNFIWHWIGGRCKTTHWWDGKQWQKEK